MNEQNNDNFFATTTGKILTTIIGYVIIFVIMLSIASATNSEILMLIIIIPCAYFGWQALEKITLNMFVWMPVGGWLLYYFFKIMLSVLVGIFVTPYQISKRIANAVSKQVDKK